MAERERKAGSKEHFQDYILNLALAIVLTPIITL
jgi:hypothetical protein